MCRPAPHLSPTLVCFGLFFRCLLGISPSFPLSSGCTLHIGLCLHCIFFVVIRLHQNDGGFRDLGARRSETQECAGENAPPRPHPHNKYMGSSLYLVRCDAFSIDCPDRTDSHLDTFIYINVCGRPSSIQFKINHLQMWWTHRFCMYTSCEIDRGVARRSDRKSCCREGQSANLWILVRAAGWDDMTGARDCAECG